jgi:hypothetical protein
MGSDTRQSKNVRTTRSPSHHQTLPLTILPRFKQDGWFYTLWDFFIPAYSCPFPVRRIGNLGDGGKFVCGVEKVVERPGCVIYSLGINGDSSFEAALLSQSPTCSVYGGLWQPFIRAHC